MAYAKLLYTKAALAVTDTGTAFTMPQADGYSFILDVTTPGGTTETLDVAIQASPDGGTTYYDWWRFTRVTTAAITHCITVQPMLGPNHGEAGTVGVVTAGGTGALNVNKSIPSSCRIKATITGTLPTYATVKVWAIMSVRSGTGIEGGL